MKYISLGQSCLASYHLRKLGLQRETHFFDWIVTSQNTVIKVLEMNDQDQLRRALTENVQFERELFEGHKAFTCQSLGLRSVHDLPADGDCPDRFRFHFVDKYIRRYNRLVEVLNSEEPVMFVMTLKKFEPTDKLTSTIQNIFPTLNFHMILIIEESNHECIKEKKVTTVFLEDYLLKPGARQTHWSLDQYDWNRILKKK